MSTATVDAMTAVRPSLRLGVLGAASIAPAAVVLPARRTPGIELAAVAARDRSRAIAFARRHGIATVHDSYEQLLADPTIDAVYIPLPNGLHGAWTIRALEAGKHVLVEKPFAANAAEAAHVAHVASASDRVVMEAFHWSYHPLATRLAEIALCGELGQITHLDGGFSFPLLKPRDIRWSRRLAGGALLDAGCYPLHQIRRLGTALSLGSPTVARAKAAVTSGGVDRELSGELVFDDGTTASLRCGFLSPRRPIDLHLRVVGDRGSVLAINPVVWHLGGHLRISMPGSTRHEFAGAVTSYTYQLRAFVDAIRDGVAVPTDADDAVVTMGLIDDLFVAAGMTPPSPTPT